MKMTPIHFETLRAALAPVVTGERFAAHCEALKADPRVKDLGKRARWDALYAVSRTSALPQGFMSSLYAYLNDDHIDTALRSIVAKHAGGAQ